MSEEGMDQYLSAFKHGMPPHGGLGHRLGASDHAADRRRQRPGNHAVPERYEPAGAVKLPGKIVTAEEEKQNGRNHYP